MKTKTKWLIISVIIYIIFVVAVTPTGILSPAQIGLPWTIFWYVVAAMFMYYFYYKNVSYAEVIYYAQQLKLTEDELRNMVPDIKKSEDVPNPAKPNLFSPLVQVSFRILNDLLPKLQQMAKEKGIEDFN
ncbi:hypothetical protein LOSG293_040300 [Secundilactobacillus oryzae JCM 18671]|uniref:Uncharacterized protein n=1 Tax=Secundilactobacillus oryzae JCM 18671 TaxID=1291743 RepID=A0A081BGW6_9LACO|nr:hypothetical protein [Secundilactobacillus oryzae]GAK47284.1 hypothetical protein LOSG293_040300 [Secundilactobacillus oryzae JCM 18671]